MAVLPVAPTEDRDGLIEALGHLSYAAQRCFPKVGTPELPTPWDLRHLEIDDLLVLLELTEEITPREL